MSKELVITGRDSEHYSSLVDACKAIITEKSFDMNWTRLEMYHAIGEAIRQSSKGEKSITKLLKDLAMDMGVVERTLWYAVQFYDKYPEIDALPDGKAASWSKVKQDLPVNKRMEAAQVTEPAEIARGIFRKFGVETSIAIMEELKILIDLNDQEF